MESGDFTIEIGDSVANLPLKATVKVESTVQLPRHYDMNSIFLDAMADPKAQAILKPFIDKAMAAFATPEEAVSEAAGEAISAEMSMAMMQYMPFRTLLSFGDGTTSEEMIRNLILRMNE